MSKNSTSEPELVKISGRGALVNIHLNDHVPVNVACRNLRERLARNRHLYAHGEVVIDVGKRIISGEEQERIRKVIESESGLTIKRFWCDPSVLDTERERITNLIASHATDPDMPHEDTQPGEANRYAPSLGGTHTVGGTDQQKSQANRHSVPADVVRGTCRAGEVLNFPGNVVVVGNVNPGAQIIAQGDILVFGTLRGTAHAGAGGDSTAVILAMSSIAPQLRIGEHLEEDDPSRGIAGRRRDDSDGTPIIARVQNRVVRVFPYLKNHSIDHGGNPNER